jgi:hypothetical protein
MNTIPTTFNENLHTYTAVGGDERRASTGLSAVVLNRGGRFSRYSFFEELEKLGFDNVLSIENSSAHYDLESLSSSFPFVRFILPQERLNRGEEINLAASELSCPLFFVLWNDLRFLRSGGSERMAERLFAGAEEEKNIYKRLCTTPLIQDGRSETMPTLKIPALLPEKKTGKVIRTIPFIPRKEGQLTLYPFDGIGIYDRERFIRLSGFDPYIKNFYWQLMDFGFRSGLWGEEIAATQLIKLSYEGLVPEEDSTVDEGSLRFFLKNLAPVFKGDYAHIPLRRFPGYLKRRGDLFAAWDEFFSARAWVRTNRFRFSSDAGIMTELFASIENEKTDTEDDPRELREEG